MACRFNIVLYEPEIPPNTGNIIRLCANTGAHLHLIEPLGFKLDNKKLRRAGLDYADWETISVYPSLNEYLTTIYKTRLFALSTRGSTRYSDIAFNPGDSLLFGPETRGLPQALLDELPANQRLFLPMQDGQRSLNLSNCVAIVLYHAWHQHNFV